MARMAAMVVAMVVAIVWLLGAAFPLQAATPHRAGLVIVAGDGAVTTRCIEFDEASISGAELLTRSGLALRLEATGMGTTVCSIAGEGCAAPSSCFCQCQSSPCIYWSYWQQVEGTWRYANLGAGMTQVGDGAVEGWVWGEGTVGGEATLTPPELSLDDICRDNRSADLTAEPLPRPGYGMPTTTLLVAGTPLVIGLLWWVAQQRRRT